MARPRTQDIVPAVAGGWVVTVAWQLSQASVTSTARYRCSALLCSTVLYCAILCSTPATMEPPGSLCAHRTAQIGWRNLPDASQHWPAVRRHGAVWLCNCVSTSNNTADCTYRHSPVPATGRGRGCGGRCTPPPPPPRPPRPPRSPRSPWSRGSG